MTESEARFEDIARKLATLEAELERSMDRCTTGGIKETGQMIIVIITYTLNFLIRSIFFLFMKSSSYSQSVHGIKILILQEKRRYLSLKKNWNLLAKICSNWKSVKRKLFKERKNTKSKLKILWNHWKELLIGMNLPQWIFRD